MAADLLEVAKAYAELINSEKSGGGTWFIETTDYNKDDGELKKYMQYQMTAEYVAGSITYENPSPTPTPDLLGVLTSTLENPTDTDGVVTLTLEGSYEQTRSFTWTTEQTTSVGVEVEASVGIGKIFSVGGSITTTISLTETKSETFEDKLSLSPSQSFDIPAKTKVTGKLILGVQAYNLTWTADMKLNGYVAVWYNNKIDMNGGTNYHHLWFHPIRTVINRLQGDGNSVADGYVVDDYGNVVVKVYGVTEGSQCETANVEWILEKLGADGSVDSTAVIETIDEQVYNARDMQVQNGGINA